MALPKAANPLFEILLHMPDEKANELTQILVETKYLPENDKLSILYTKLIDFGNYLPEPFNEEWKEYWQEYNLDFLSSGNTENFTICNLDGFHLFVLKVENRFDQPLDLESIYRNSDISPVFLEAKRSDEVYNKPVAKPTATVIQQPQENPTWVVVQQQI
ncbi:MAG: hypothetical protein ACRCXC_10620 [Legionella sp.]